MSVEAPPAVLDPAAGRVQHALRALAAGEPIVLVDDVRRGGEGALVLPAGAATPHWIAFLVRHTTGFLRVAMEEEACDRLELPLMRRDRTDRFGSALCVTVDGADVGTGISATARARTIKALARPDSHPGEFIRPGHVVPVRARNGGLSAREGRAEAVVDLMRLAALAPAGVFSEIVASELTGETARGREPARFAAEHELACVSVSDVVACRRRSDPQLVRTGDTPAGEAFPGVRLVTYRGTADEAGHLAIVAGDPRGAPVVVHRECVDGNVLGLSTCDCGIRWRDAVESVVRSGRGIAISIRLPDASPACPARDLGTDPRVAAVAERIVQDLRG
ncbi:3,4-dihydroxy-2-butanone-4-phosphate synthase [Amycolatopsis thermophila]|uniref:3,4-dihydroxy-2-butanone-4-phosphate synthase n=1 Tax=Amycolatopsis thermophila TaxID=206084 RepID=A0ABU0F5K7_9PSEU|nr:3,4-dihydroxy-2-butanone-4-phosphate synthase [Amycolatopsis thermophila]MDQ0382874.1 3,4-dihydroxy 2-butanone 4-phosphate synthase/GTP cyclohydrolase II [Amycolatopsis thermophila]